MQRSILLLALVACLLAAPAVNAQTRQWTDVSGEFSLRAKLISVENGAVKLQKPDGRTLTVPLNKLSQADRDFLSRTREEPAAADDWRTWRGPLSNGVAVEQTPPTQWSDSENVIWKTEVPGRGHSSPIVVGDQVILTTAVDADKSQQVLSYDRNTGKLRWRRSLHQNGFQRQIHAKNTQATPTAGSNGQQIFVVFPHNDAIQLTALDLQGQPQWSKTVGPYRPQKYKFGYAASPLLYKNLVIVSVEFDDDRNSAITAFAQSDGKQVWRAPRPRQITFSSPIVGRTGGRDQLLISGAKQVSSYDPNTGKPLWSCEGTTDATCGTLIWSDQVVFASGGYPKKETIAVASDGSRRVVWKNGEKCYEQSMLHHDGHIYAVNDGGVAMCWDAQSGRTLWKQRLAGPVSASPILAGGHIYFVNERGQMFVFKASPQSYQQVARFSIGDEGFATPAFCGDQIFLRTARGGGGSRQEFLVCIGK